LLLKEFVKAWQFLQHSQKTNQNQSAVRLERAEKQICGKDGHGVPCPY
jgi:hypothetical protein